MAKWFLAMLLAIEAHFAVSYIVLLDTASQQFFGGLRRWVWPWSDGDGGPLGWVTVASGFPIAGFVLAVAAAGLTILAALTVIGPWVPVSWWRVLAPGGAVLPLILMVCFPGPTKLLPMALDLAVLWTATTHAFRALVPE